MSDPKVSNNFAQLAQLFEECFVRLYPAKTGHSEGYLKTRKELRQFDLEHELPAAAEQLKQHAVTVDLIEVSYQALVAAAGRSNWIQHDYSATDWMADCIFFLEHGHPKPGDELLPINMVLHCPKCHFQHVDRAESAEEYAAKLTRSRWWQAALAAKPTQWLNPPHRSHLCHACGHIWRPADVYTNGVLFTQTRGTNDSPLPKQQGAKPI